MNQILTKCLTATAGRFAVGALCSALLSLSSLLIISVLWKTLPVLTYSAPNGSIMNLAREANQYEFDRLRTISTWVLFLGPFFTGYCWASIRRLNLGAFLASSLATLFLTSATLFIAATMWSFTHLNGGGWHLSGHSRIESYGKHPSAVLDHQLLFTVASGMLHIVGFFAGLIWTNNFLKKESQVESTKD